MFCRYQNLQIDPIIGPDYDETNFKNEIIQIGTQPSTPTCNSVLHICTGEILR